MTSLAGGSCWKSRRSDETDSDGTDSDGTDLDGTDLDVTDWYGDFDEPSCRDET